MEVNEARCANDVCTRHIGKEIAIENGVALLWPQRQGWTRAPEPTLIEDRAKNSSDDQMEFGATKHTPSRTLKCSAKLILRTGIAETSALFMRDCA